MLQRAARRGWRIRFDPKCPSGKNDLHFCDEACVKKYDEWKKEKLERERLERVAAAKEKEKKWWTKLIGIVRWKNPSIYVKSEK